MEKRNKIKIRVTCSERTARKVERICEVDKDEYENNYDFLNPEGQKVAKDVIKKHLYSINELENLYTKKYLNK